MEILYTNISFFPPKLSLLFCNGEKLILPAMSHIPRVKLLPINNQNLFLNSLHFPSPMESQCSIYRRKSAQLPVSKSPSFKPILFSKKAWVFILHVLHEPRERIWKVAKGQLPSILKSLTVLFLLLLRKWRVGLGAKELKTENL